MPANRFLRAVAFCTTLWLLVVVEAFGQGNAAYTIVTLNVNNTQIMEVGLDGKIKRTERTGSDPHEVAISADNHFFVTNTVEPSVSVINGANFKEVVRLRSPYFGGAGREASAMPHGIDLSHDGKTLYITTERAAKPGVVSFDREKGVARKYIATSQEGGHLVRVHPTEERAYVVNSRSNSVSVIDTRSDVLERNIDLPGGPIAMDFAGNGDLWVTTNEGTVYVVDAKTHSVRHRLAGKGKGNGRIALSPDGRIAVATHADGADVFDARAARWLTYFPIENDQTVTGVKHAIYMCFSPSGDRMYLSAINASSILVIDSNTYKEIARWKLPTPAYTVDIFYPQGKPPSGTGKR